MTDVSLEIIKGRIAKPGWTPGKKDISGLFFVWRQLTDDERDQISKRLSQLDAPSIGKAVQLFFSLDPRSRGELARPILRSYLRVATNLIVADIIEFPYQCLTDAEVRVRKSAAQAIGASWSDLPQIIKSPLVTTLLHNLKTVHDASEKKALIDCLSKSGMPEAVTALSHVENLPSRAKLTVLRDVLRGDVSGDRCHPELLLDHGLFVWFTPGIEIIAKMKKPFSEGTFAQRGLLKLTTLKTPEAMESFANNVLWRKFGCILGEIRDDSPEKLANFLAIHSDQIKSATEIKGGGPVRIRLGRDGERSRSQIWEFAGALETLNCGLMNDGREAHWDLKIIDSQVLLVPLMFHDARFHWRSPDTEGTSDPTLAGAMVDWADLKAGFSVYDPFCGAGTELILAGRSGSDLKLFGTDTNQSCVDTAIKSMRFAKVTANIIKDDCLANKDGPFDVVITNPPFGMRTVRGEARGLLAEFLETIHLRLKPSAVVVLLSHAPRSTAEWASRGHLKFLGAIPISLGRLDCEIQKYEFRP